MRLVFFVFPAVWLAGASAVVMFESDGLSLGIVLILSVVIGWFVFRARYVGASLVVYNLDYDTVYQCICKVLNERNMEYEQKGRTIGLPSVQAEITLRDVRGFRSVRVFFGWKESGGLVREVARRLRQVAAEGASERRSSGGVARLGFGVLMVAMVIRWGVVLIRSLGNLVSPSHAHLPWVP